MLQSSFIINVPNRLFYLSAVLLLFSCTKDVTIELPESPSEIVVEGHIEQGKKATVYLSNSQSYFSPLDSSALLSYAVKGALVTVSDGTTTDTLKAAIPSIGYFYMGSKLLGEVGKSYALSVTVNGKTLTSQTTIPAPVKLDSAWFKPRTAGDTLGQLWVHLSDPAPLGNFYRSMTKRTNKKYYRGNAPEDFYPPRFSVYDDKFFNGKSFDFFLQRGNDPGKPVPENDEERQFRGGSFTKGDTIQLKWISIDRAQYEYYKTFQVIVNSGGSPFATPVTVKSNINGGIGVWGGYGVSITTVIAR